jgi:hypothetical protein
VAVPFGGAYFAVIVYGEPAPVSEDVVHWACPVVLSGTEEHPGIGEPFAVNVTDPVGVYPFTGSLTVAVKVIG